MPKLAHIITSIIVVIVCFLVGYVIVGFSPLITLAIVLIAVVFVVTLMNPEWGLALLIFSMLLSPEIILGQVPGRDIVLRFEDLLLAIFTFTWLAKTAINKGLSLFIRTPLNKAIGVYIVICIIATLKGTIFGFVIPAKAFFFVLRYIEYFLLFIMVANHIRSKKQIKFFLGVFFITCAIVSFYGLLQIPSGARVSAPFEGDLGEPNTFGGYLLFMFCIALGLIQHNIPRRLKLSLAGVCLLMALPFLFTMSRASYLGIAFSFITFIFLSKKKGHLIVALAVILLAVVLIRPQAVFSRVEYTFQDEKSQTEKIGNIHLDPSASARILSWKVAIEVWMKNPVLGRGVTGHAFTDGQYVRTLPELGIIGLFVLLWLMWLIFKNALRIYHQMDDELYKGLSVGFLAGFAGLAIHALTANTFIIIRIMEPFWFMAGIVMILPTLGKKELDQNEGEENISSGS